MKRVLDVIILLMILFLSLSTYASNDNNKEILVRLPLLSAKNAQIITNAIDSIKGVKSIEACFELRVLMIDYDCNEIVNDNYLVNLINELKINTVAEMIHESDIPIIKSQYKISSLYTTKEKSD